MSEENLLVFSIGPVQRFIAAARKVEDLWSGSYLLSHLAEQAIVDILETAEGKGIQAEVIFPAINLDQLQNKASQPHIEVASLPNRFVCQIKADQGVVAELAEKATNRIESEFINIGDFAIDRVFPDNANKAYMKSILRQQVKSLLEVFWACETMNTDLDYGRAYRAMEKRLAAVKNARPYNLNMQRGLVCTLCGEQQALTCNETINTGDNYAVMKNNLVHTWDKRNSRFKVPVEQDGEEKAGRIKDGEGLCGICLAKRLARDYFSSKYHVPGSFEAFPSTQDIAGGKKYYAIIMMDGDDMGKWLSRQKMSDEQAIDIKYHRSISGWLNHFALNRVPVLVKEYKGTLIYAGGDDVLAFVPVKDVLALAKGLRSAFSDSKPAGIAGEATASMGIVIGHAKAPLQMLLNYARHMEQAAKSYIHPETHKSKDAIGIAVITRSGEIRKAILPWSMDGGNYSVDKSKCSVTYLMEIFELIKNQLSVSFIENFSQAFLPLLGSGIKGKTKLCVHSDQRKNQTILEVEMKRVLQRSLREDAVIPDLNLHAVKMIELHELMSSSLQFIHFLEMARFYRRMEEMV